MSRIIWDRVRDDGLRQTCLPFVGGPVAGGAAAAAAARKSRVTGSKRARPTSDYMAEAAKVVRQARRVHRAGIDTAVVAEAVLGPAAAAATRGDLFLGLCLQFNPGLVLAEELSSYHLEHVVKHYGGRVCYFPKDGVTHVVATNLSFAKTQDIAARGGRTAKGATVVTPAWVLDTLRANARQPEAAYGLLASGRTNAFRSMPEGGGSAVAAGVAGPAKVLPMLRRAGGGGGGGGGAAAGKTKEKVVVVIDADDSSSSSSADSGFVCETQRCRPRRSNSDAGVAATTKPDARLQQL